MLLDQLKSDLISAQKNRDQDKVDTLRFLLGAINDLEIAKYPPSVGGKLSEDDVSTVIKKQVKTHKESIEMFEKGNRPDLVEKEKVQLLILQSYLPEQMSEEEIKNKIQDLRKNNPTADFGMMMKLAMGELTGKADGATVSKLLREIL